jgi:hypothetical protein
MILVQPHNFQCSSTVTASCNLTLAFALLLDMAREMLIAA